MLKRLVKYLTTKLEDDAAYMIAMTGILVILVLGACYLNAYMGSPIKTILLNTWMIGACILCCLALVAWAVGMACILLKWMLSGVWAMYMQSTGEWVPAGATFIVSLEDTGIVSLLAGDRERYAYMRSWDICSNFDCEPLEELLPAALTTPRVVQGCRIIRRIEDRDGWPCFTVEAGAAIRNGQLT